MKNIDTYYAECCCYDLDHLVRFYYDNNLHIVSIDFNLMKYPIEPKKKDKIDVSYKYTKNFIQRLFLDAKYKLLKIIGYFENILWAIKGRPNWFTAYTEIDCEQLYDLRNFLNSCIKNWEDYLDKQL